MYIWLLVPLVVFWANVHGGYVYAFLVLIPFVGWHAIMHLSRRWMIAVYSILLWLVLCGMGNQFTHHPYLTPIPLGKDALFYLTVICHRREHRPDGQPQGPGRCPHHLSRCHILLSVPAVIIAPFLPGACRGDRPAPDGRAVKISTSSSPWPVSPILGSSRSRCSSGRLRLFLRDKVVRVMDRKGILHTMAAGVVAFVAMVIFNPFHLTNLTHTFEISVSKHAERWRNVYEWHRAFEWDNPVGTAVPFLMMYILAWLILIAWTIAFIRACRGRSIVPSAACTKVDGPVHVAQARPGPADHRGDDDLHGDSVAAFHPDCRVCRLPRCRLAARPYDPDHRCRCSSPGIGQL